MAIDVAAWYEKYGPMVIRRCRSLLRNDDEAMDAVQDVFVNLLRAEGRLRGTFPSSLLYTIATNLCLNRLRSGKETFFDGNDEFFSATDGAYDQVDTKLLVEAILKDESEKTRTICFMYHADGMTLREIAEAMRLSVSGVRKRLETFKKRARLKLGEDYR
jgi:RNA polymerase sigma-70 factor (ECF subfamily)